MNDSYTKILELMVGKKEFKKFLNTLFKDIYNKKPNIRVDNIENIVSAYSTLIIGIGLYKDKINTHQYKIELLNSKELDIYIKDVEDEYGEYIKKVNGYKKNLLNKFKSE